MRKKLSGLRKAERKYWFNQIGVTERELAHGAVRRLAFRPAIPESRVKGRPILDSTGKFIWFTIQSISNTRQSPTLNRVNTRLVH